MQYLSPFSNVTNSELCGNDNSSSSSGSGSITHLRVQKVHVYIHVMIRGCNLYMGLNRRVVDITIHL